MKLQTISNYAVFFALVFIVDSSVAFNCDTTLIANDPGQEYNDQIYLADCRIEMQDSSPFIISSGHTAKLSAEQIRLDPGFHAQRGSHFHAKYRDCVRNPDKNTGFAAWGEPDVTDPAHPRWIEEIAEKFVDKFNQGTGYSVELKYDDAGLDPDLVSNLYRDSISHLASPGRDDDEFLYQINEGTISERAIKVQGIDKGVFFFHAGHGGGSVKGPIGRNGYRLRWRDMQLGNCSIDGSASGELRYFFACSCRPFAHGPGVVTTDSNARVEYDRPSEFDPSYVANTSSPFSGKLPDSANIFERFRLDNLGPVLPGDDPPVLSRNMRMACGSSTTAHCNVNNSPDSVVDHMRALYYFYNVADSWGYANARYDRGDFNTRHVIQTPLCIAIGNYNGDDLRSPITEDQFFTEKANPYDEALHVKSWETVATRTGTDTDGDGDIDVWDKWFYDYDVTPHDSVGGSPIKDDQHYTRRAINPYVKVSHVMSNENLEKTSASLKEHINKLPVFLTVTSTPTWFVEESQILGDVESLKTQKSQNEFNIHNDKLISKNLTNDGRPRVNIDTRTGAVTLAGDRKPVRVNDKNSILSVEKYADKVRNFIDKQGWSENDVGDISVVSGMLQVKPIDSKADASNLLKVQNDIAFFVGRRIPLGKISPKVLGSDSQIVVQMNNDGSFKTASKKWRKITQRIEGYPVKSYEAAYAEAVKKFKYPGLYELSTWDWGYKSITDDSGQDMMVIYYVFTFEPLSIVNACIDMPRVIEIQGHILEKIKGLNHQKGQQRL